MKYISVIKLREHLTNNNEVAIVDVREPYELEICSIGGQHIPMGEIASRISELDRERTLAFLCKTGNRAEAVANLLMTEYGFSNVTVVKGGIIAWIEEIDNSLESY